MSEHNMTIRNGKEGHYAIDNGDDLSCRRPLRVVHEQVARIRRLSLRVTDAEATLKQAKKALNGAKAALKLMCPHPQKSITGGYGADGYGLEECRLCGKSVWI